MVINDLKRYWTLISAHRRRNEPLLSTIKLMSTLPGREGRLAQLYLLSLKGKP